MKHKNECGLSYRLGCDNDECTCYCHDEWRRN